MSILSDDNHRLPTAADYAINIGVCKNVHTRLKLLAMCEGKPLYRVIDDLLRPALAAALSKYEAP